MAELNATNNALVRSYAWGLDLSGTMDEAGGVGGLLWVNDASTINSQPSTHFVSYDGNGNVTALVDAGSGNETARYEYGPFGDLTKRGRFLVLTTSCLGAHSRSWPASYEWNIPAQFIT